MDQTLSEEELARIHQYTRRELKPEEVYAFSVVLCDNDIDRDGERFSDEALEKLAQLFLGVTGIKDHDPSSENQLARIYDTAVETVPGRTTTDGRPYLRLRAKAYMPKTEQTAEWITALESGIKKEVSVGCAVGRRSCSICGKPVGECSHRVGKCYHGKLCAVLLEEPTDAYEWSFVAVPAQRAAGVIKNYRGDDMDIEKRLFSGEEQTFTAEEMKMIGAQLHSLSKRASDGDAYRRKLETDILKAAVLLLPEVPGRILSEMTAGLDAAQLEELYGSLKKKTAMPLQPQLAVRKNAAGEKDSGNNDFTNI